MKWNKKIIFLLLGVGLIGSMLFFLISFRKPTAHRQKLSGLPTSAQWKTFQGENPPFNFTFEYPAAWKTITSRFSGKFDLVSVSGPQEEKTRFVVSVFVTKKSVPSGKTVEQLAEDALSKKKGLPKFEMHQKKERKTGLGTMLGVEYQYTDILPLYAPQRQKVIIRNQELFLIKNNFYYRISFIGTQDQYNAFLSAFDHTLETFKLLD